MQGSFGSDVAKPRRPAAAVDKPTSGPHRQYRGDQPVDDLGRARREDEARCWRSDLLLRPAAELQSGRGVAALLLDIPLVVAVDVLVGVEFERRLVVSPGDVVLGHPTKGTPLETGELAKRYLKQALARAEIEKSFRPFPDLQHTSLTLAAAAGNPQIYVQARAGHSQGSITERYMDAAQVLFPGAAAKIEAKMFSVLPSRTPHSRRIASYAT